MFFFFYNTSEMYKNKMEQEQLELDVWQDMSILHNTSI